MNLWLWIAQDVLAVLYLVAGGLKAIQSKEWIDKTMGWSEDYDGPFVKFVGVMEVAGALGLILPLWTGILPWLTPLAALGLTIIQLLAMGVHYRRGEVQALPFNLVLLALSLFILWGRWGLFFGVAT